MKNLLILLLIFSSSQLLNAQEKWTTKSNDKFSISIPESWDWDDSGKMGTEFILFAPMDEGKDFFLENLNLIVQDISEMELSLDEYIKLSENSITTLTTNSEILLSERVTKNESEYHYLAYTGTQGTLKLRFDQHIRVIDKQAIILTFTSEEKSFENYKKSSKKIMESFQLIQ